MKNGQSVGGRQAVCLNIALEFDFSLPASAGAEGAVKRDGNIGIVPSVLFFPRMLRPLDLLFGWV